MKTWTRKDVLARADGTAKHITIGTEVVVVAASPARWEHGFAGARIRIARGRRGKVIASGSAERWAAKRAVGTISAVLVEWEDE